jgi:hypothetical protein
MITKIRANGSSDINMLLVSPAPAAWAYAGVMNIRTILVETGEAGQALAATGSVKFARTIAAIAPIATLPDRRFGHLAAGRQAR